MKKYLHTYLLSIITLTCTLQTVAIENTDALLDTIAHNISIIVANKGTNPEANKARVEARKQITSALTTLKKDKNLTQDATTLGTHVRRLDAMARKNENTQSLEADIATTVNILTQKKITELETQAQQTESMLSRLRTRAQGAYLWAAEQFVGYTPAEKEAAREMIAQLQEQKNILEADQQNPEMTRAQKTDIKKQIAEINKQIHAQKVITGEKWSTARRAAYGTAALAGTIGATTLGYHKGYKPRQERLAREQKERQFQKEKQGMLAYEQMMQQQLDLEQKQIAQNLKKQEEEKIKSQFKESSIEKITKEIKKREQDISWYSSRDYITPETQNKLNQYKKEIPILKQLLEEKEAEINANKPKS